MVKHKIKIHPIAKDGFYFAVPFFLIAVSFYLVGFKAISVIAFICSLFSIFFFRDPKRIIRMQPNSIVSAADGKIKAIEEIYESTYLKEPAVKIVTFLSPFNVHINRAPINGVITNKTYEKGKYYPAFMKKAHKNQKNYVFIENEDLSVIAIQMVGSLARRIVSWVDIGQSIDKGGKIGLIRFGSRTDVIIPKSKLDKILVKPGDKVKAGESILATTKK
ncbi:MAG: phosphatidylserine decarboxylase [Candidatus Aenigmarchaeota archaeon]|nr:phosphatidylserine decarboxylase [Candidatus Aenigmarchaeota archaeon]